ncbi:uncharacterized protein TRAVEDRAFT_71791 [Trametes versicolor FP-101664 SS1]|uniref:uncharacterized protein n=1 Tax=Trametes versicolor (strain FP-101664) TaxID=717944 RepID=UPI0004624145|nr:uncharacterized protein TRAVEDRAFT_71791 [Trametes versicolor FP-101664 SS1]EIW59909.1 hypothetical protein TRAVEDRAFT_71791 [Trametes versicolor FP-101664 SS1]
MSSRTPMTPIITPFRWLTLLSLPAYAAAQYGYYDGGGTSGRAIAGIVVAICFAILFFIFVSLFFRRRRRGVPMLPWQGNTVPLGTHYPNPNQSAYPAMNHQSSWGPGAGAYQPPPGPPPQAEFMPPPPYVGKPPAYEGEENSGYGTPHSPTQQPPEAPQPGGFVVPQSPHSPAAAHVNSSPHSPWFRSS